MDKNLEWQRTQVQQRLQSRLRDCEQHRLGRQLAITPRTSRFVFAGSLLLRVRHIILGLDRARPTRHAAKKRPRTG